ncbi:MAG: radical SAM protein [Verrucomicrobia bacterium]|nr:radical SAM protein [Verrucomicrobiota bacterium]
MTDASPHKAVYGPVPSRRLGRSLGVSPIPRKVCSYSCVYCQLGPTTRLTVERRSYFPKEMIAEQIAAALPGSDADYVTFAGDGEPTLCADLGWLVHLCKTELKARVAVITNGSLLDRPDVRANLLEADVVMPSLDAGSAAVFRQINRPHPRLDYEQIIEGLVAFRRAFPGLLWTEVMLVAGLNDSAKSLGDLKRVLDRVEPDRVDLMVPVRPPTERGVKAPSPSVIHTAREILGHVREITGYEEGLFGTARTTDPEGTIMDICLRHPLREEQARQIEQRMGVPGLVADLIAHNQISRVTYNGVPYLVAVRDDAAQTHRGTPGKEGLRNE